MRGSQRPEFCGLCNAGILHSGRPEDEAFPYDGGAGSGQTDYRQLSGRGGRIPGGGEQSGE